MEEHNHSILALLAFLFFFFFVHLSSLLLSCGQLLPIVDQGGNATRIQTYIVHVQRPIGTKFLGDVDRENWHQSFLPNTTLDSGEPRLVYSYRHAISGFAARLTPSEVSAMVSIDAFLQAQPDERRPLLTTHTPDFLGLSQRYGIWYENSYGSGVIVGVLDSGIVPTHPSFQDRGMPPPPTRWDGSCDFRDSVCNNKLIGATAFHHGRPTVIDSDDAEHGTHIASIAAGNFVDGAEVLGNANGTSVGMAPKAHLAIYKVCSKTGCHDSDILAGIDQAIHDDVDVLSISIGAARPRPLYEDSIAIGSFAATRRKILTSVAAGNDGPLEGTVVNDAPWALTVGAASTDRRIIATVRLGNGTELVGESAYQPMSLNSTLLPITFPGFNGQNGTDGCRNDSFSNIDVQGKIVLCEIGYNISNIEKGKVVKRARGAAMIILNQYEQGLTTFSEAHVLPAVHLSFPDSLKIVSYFNSSTNSTPLAAIMFNGTQFGARPSPAVAYFSSRGPSTMNGGILKPDIIGPGVNILAAWPTKVGPNYMDSTASYFNFLSGTSIATAHLSGIVALIKNGHRHWTTSAIKSAIMTTADRMDGDGETIVDQFMNGTARLFATGAGHVNASRANHPGLVYELRSHHYIHYLCGLGYTDQQVLVITQHQVDCSRIHHDQVSAEQLNYPSISLTMGFPSRKTITRKVKNVGEANSVYYVEIEEPEGVAVEVSPYRLHFSSLYERKHFHVVFRTTNSTTLRKGQVSQGQLSWISKMYTVRSPISIIFT